MAGIPITFSTGAGNAIGNPIGLGGTTAIPGFAPSTVNDVNNLGVGNASDLTNGCPCTPPVINYGDLHCSYYLDKNLVFLFQKKKMKQVFPSNNGSVSNNLGTTNICYNFPSDGLKSTVNYHVINEYNTDSQDSQLQDDPSLTHERLDIRSIKTNADLNSIKTIGYQKIVGDGPGLSNGKIISFEQGKINRNILKSTDVYKKYSFTVGSNNFTSSKNTDGSIYYIINGINGIYIKTVTFYVNALAANNRNLNLFFKYNLNSNQCGETNYQISLVTEKETVVDNIPQNSTSSVSLSNSTPKQDLSYSTNSGNTFSVDCGLATADYIEVRSANLPTFFQVDITYLDQKTYLENILTTENSSSCIDEKGRIFVFYEEELNYSELPYSFTDCYSSSSFTSSIPSSSSTTSAFTGIGGTGGFGNGSGSSGGGTGGGSNGSGSSTGSNGGSGSGIGGSSKTGGIPGQPPANKTYSSSSSSTSSGGSGTTSSGGSGGSGTTSSGGSSGTSSGGSGSTSSGGTSATSSSSTTSGSNIPTTNTPQIYAPINPGASVDLDTNGNPNVILTWSDGAPSGTISSTVGYNIYRSNLLNGTYVEIGTSQTTTFTDTSPLSNSWNYYRIKAYNASNQESSYLLIQIFVVPPVNCAIPNCAGCNSSGYKSKDSFSVNFSTFAQYQLTFNCNNPCNPLYNSFIVILPSSFTTSSVDQYGDAIPQEFCLLRSCNDANILKQCTWTNTFFINAIVYNCKGFGCNGYTDSNGIFHSSFQEVLLPFTVNLYQDAKLGWKLEAYCMNDQCQRMPLFSSSWQSTACSQPVTFISEIQTSLSAANGYNNASWGNSACSINIPTSYQSKCGTISVAMSDDLGKSWYKFQGVTYITSDRKAVKPIVTYDKKTDIIHCFYAERDYTIDNGSIASTTNPNGYDAFLIHIPFKASNFVQEDSFKAFYPSPTQNTNSVPNPLSLYYGSYMSSSSSTSVLIKSQYITSDKFAIDQLSAFTNSGKTLRTVEKNVLFYEQNAPNATATNLVITSKDQSGNYLPTSNTINILNETYSSYIDNKGKLYFVRNGISGTLVDPPDRLTRIRRSAVTCGDYSWAVSGITDTDCACQSLTGIFDLQLNTTTGNYEHAKWTLTVSSDYNYWVMSADNGMMIFQKERETDQCPPTGIYQMTCNRCLGNITGTLGVNRLGVYGNGNLIDSSNLPASALTDTDFGIVPVGSYEEQTYTITNTTSSTILFTDNPTIHIIGTNASEFYVSNPPYQPTSIKPNQSINFTIRFTPSATNCGDPSNLASVRTAQVRIKTNSLEYGTYYFNITGTCTSAKTGQSAILGSNGFAPGSVYVADSVGTLYNSTDQGKTWNTRIEDIKTGQNGYMFYDAKSDSIENIYITNQMVFIRRYPALFHSNTPDPPTQLDQSYDGENIITTTETLIPNTDVFQSGIAVGIGDLGADQTLFSLPNITIPGQILAQFEPDLTSIKTALINEKDIGGVPIFLSGNKRGALINGYYPYTNNYLFDQNLAVAAVKPTGYVTRKGSIRFFYIDSNGNINGGTINGTNVRLDTKLFANG